MVEQGDGSAFGLYYVVVAQGPNRVPWWFALVLFFCDMIYLPPFYVIIRRLNRLAAER